ncbi:hypothetical protein I6A84_19660 [Frankia sp. CNm7]|uniref:Uncharacterized protein n=1 Tax=Frankia nepalensis TaxID=1836974 RepID=A0A937RKK5_9ACTN|nr:hypothetical protein [Frankia nepalensis]MBL7496294.1 hypothetical protein [Frankia nepalensis]MBL7508509.1 hypothetical protein [Frankia nepalensis]MBL7520242.1 hypothetical protein [Frankia nepalensis]MBL7627641.1 hypothetical protein [Frankia nepalensis]
MYRQGDILILPVLEQDVPDSARDLPSAPRDDRGRLVLALGEATGHAHAIAGPGTLLRASAPLVPDYLHLPSGGRLVHEEHAPISLPKGWFRVIRQREYVPGAVRVVAD